MRFSLFDALTDGDDDLDMYVYYRGTQPGQSRTRLGESGEPTSQERFDIYRPAAGIYGILVHGFETDEVSGGPGSNYRVLKWNFGVTDDAGNMTVSGPAFVAAGTTGYRDRELVRARGEYDLPRRHFSQHTAGPV